jgi:hypothetical protein
MGKTCMWVSGNLGWIRLFNWPKMSMN